MVRVLIKSFKSIKVGTVGLKRAGKQFSKVVPC